MTKTAFFDADILLHRAVSFVDDEFDGEVCADWKTALKYFDWLLDSWKKQVGKIDDYYLVVSNGKNFRHRIFPDYKANRKDIVPHPAFAGLKEEVMERDMTLWEDDIEADDLIGIKCSEDKDNTVAVSADKDFATVPCNLIIPKSHGRTAPIKESFSEEEANLNWLRQCMTGDTIDNFKGIPGIGPKKANAILPRHDTIENMWPKVSAAFLEKGLGEDHALLMARLARILRKGEFNFDTKEVQLWKPPSARETLSEEVTDESSETDENTK